MAQGFRAELLWSMPFKTEYDQNIVTPVLYKDTMIFSRINKGVFAVRLAHSGEKWSTQTVWQNQDVSMYMNSPVLAGDLLVGFSHLKKRQIFCLDARTGATHWTGSPRGGDNAAILTSSSTLFALTSRCATCGCPADTKGARRDSQVRGRR